MAAYFFFGSMMDRDVLDLVVGRTVPDADVEPATLAGTRLVRVADESYPAIVPHAGGQVEGMRVRRLTSAESERIAWFEGKEYASRMVEVTLRSGTPARASVHLPTEALETAGGEGWDFARWRHNEKDGLMRLARGHMALFGRVSLDQAIRIWDDARAVQAGEARPARALR